jgi:hypothetical protein
LAKLFRRRSSSLVNVFASPQAWKTNRSNVLYFRMDL